MCYKGKCFYCIKVETGTKIFAIINVVCAAFVMLACIILLVLFNVLWAAIDQQNFIAGLLTSFSGIRINPVTLGGAIGNIILALVTLIVLMHFIFSILLADGICKKIPSKMKAYFGYGVFINVSSYILLIVALSYSARFSDVQTLLIIQLIYTSILVMIRMTYLKVNGAVYVYDQNQGDRQYVRLVAA